MVLPHSLMPHTLPSPGELLAWEGVCFPSPSAQTLHPLLVQALVLVESSSLGSSGPYEGPTVANPSPCKLVSF